MYHSTLFTFLALLLTSVLSYPPAALFINDARAGDVQYVYDDLGRLIAVVDGTGRRSGDLSI